MSIELKNEKNYAAQVIRVPNPFPIPNADRLVGLGVLGYTVITAKDGNILPGDLAVFFPAESQLSEALTAHANLYRHSELNDDPTEKGYLEDNRRVRALKLRGTVSNGLILPLAVVEELVGFYSFAEGGVFDTVNGIELCRKYVIPVKENTSVAQSKIVKAFKRVDAALFPEHLETDQYLRNEHLIPDHATIIVTQKLHGTSVRLGRVPVRNELTWLERLARKVGIRVQERTYDAIAGSRKVIKDPNADPKSHFYGVDVWTEQLERYQDLIPANVIVYGELVGFTSEGAPLQKGYTYQVPAGTQDLYVYRVAIITDDGGMWDLSWDQVRHFCQTRGLNHTPELWRGFKSDFHIENFEEKAFYVTNEWVDSAVPLSQGGTGKDEGIVIRADLFSQVPTLMKFKNPSFYLHETEGLDAGEVDLESAA